MWVDNMLDPRCIDPGCERRVSYVLATQTCRRACQHRRLPCTQTTYPNSCCPWVPSRGIPAGFMLIIRCAHLQCCVP